MITVKISPEMVEQLRGGWSPPVQVSLLKEVNGEYTMVARKCEECIEAHKEHSE